MHVGLVGVGAWGQNHARTWGRMLAAGEIDGLSICDVDRARAQALADEVGGTAVFEVRALLDDPTVDAVDLCTPTPTHHALASQAMEAGKDVLVEKPLAGTPKEANDLVAIAKARGRVLLCGHLFRYHPGIEAARAMIARHELGSIRYFLSSRQAFRAPRADMGVLEALGVHDVDLFCWLLGVDYPRSLHASIGAWNGPGVDEVAMLSMDFGGGAKAWAWQSWLSPGAAGKERKLTIVGERATVEIDYLRLDAVRVTPATIARKGDDLVADAGATREVRTAGHEPLMAELRDFVRCVRERAPPRADADAAARAVVMIEAALESARTQRPVTFPGPPGA